jgi:phytoene desaturase
MLEEVRRVCGPTSAQEYDRYCDWLERLCRLELPSFLDRNYDSPAGLLHPIRPAISLLAMGALGRLERRVRRAFSDERLRRVFSFQSLYAGVSPQQALAVLAVIAYMDVVAGVWFPEGGIHAVATGLAAAAVKAGVDVRFTTPVERIVLAGGDHGRVRGVATPAGFLDADIVVCNADLPGAYRLVPGMPPPRRLRDPHLSPSALVWHGGVSGAPGPTVAHHNIHFGGAWHGSFDELMGQRQRMSDPSILVSVPTVSDPSLAPSDSSVLYGLEPVPNLQAGIDWAGGRQANEDAMIARLGELGYPVDDIAVSWLVDPADWAQAGLVAGTPFSIAHRFFQSGPFRPANVDRRAPGLVFVGSGTVPGVGVPMVLLSGRLAADRADAAVSG